MKWKHFPRYWPFVRGIHRSTVNSPHKGQWRRALMFSLVYPWLNAWVNNREAGDLRRYRVHYDVIVMTSPALGQYYDCLSVSKTTKKSKTQQVMTWKRFRITGPLCGELWWITSWWMTSQRACNANLRVSLLIARISSWTNSGGARGLRRQDGYYHLTSWRCVPLFYRRIMTQFWILCAKNLLRHKYLFTWVLFHLHLIWAMKLINPHQYQITSYSVLPPCMEDQTIPII